MSIDKKRSRHFIQTKTMFAPDVYSTFRGMSEGSSDGSMYRGEFHNESSFPYEMNSYRGIPFLNKTKIVEVQPLSEEDAYIQEFVEIKASYNEIHDLKKKGGVDNSGSVDNYVKWLKSKERHPIYYSISPIQQLIYDFAGPNMQQLLREKDIDKNNWKGIIKELIIHFANKYDIIDHVQLKKYIKAFVEEISHLRANADHSDWDNTEEGYVGFLKSEKRLEHPYHPRDPKDHLQINVRSKSMSIYLYNQLCPESCGNEVKKHVNISEIIPYIQQKIIDYFVTKYGL
jgi:hypothetical protein